MQVLSIDRLPNVGVAIALGQRAKSAAQGIWIQLKSASLTAFQPTSLARIALIENFDWYNNPVMAFRVSEKGRKAESPLNE